MTGLRPDSTRVWDLKGKFRVNLPDVVTLPQHFKNCGYHTRSIGKIYHGGGKPSKDPPSWSVEPMYDSARDASTRYALPGNLAGTGLKRSAAEAADVFLTWPDTVASVGATATEMQDRAATHGRSLAIGLRSHVIVRETEQEARAAQRASSRAEQCDRARQYWRRLNHPGPIYEVDDQGIVRAARIVPPTSQNQARIEVDLRRSLYNRLAIFVQLLYIHSQLLSNFCRGRQCA